jgi:bacterioferritin
LISLILATKFYDKKFTQYKQGGILYTKTITDGVKMKPLKVDIPYPTLANIERDEKTAFIISPAYSGLHSELKAILQYVYHAQFFSEERLLNYQKILISISIAEMEHLQILGQLLLKLGADPIYTVRAFDKYNYFTTSYVSQSKTPEKIILDDITGELSAINDYTEMISRLKNEKVSAIISRIRLDEELHVKALKEILNEL